LYCWPWCRLIFFYQEAGFSSSEFFWPPSFGLVSLYKDGHGDVKFTLGQCSVALYRANPSCGISGNLRFSGTSTILVMWCVEKYGFLIMKLNPRLGMIRERFLFIYLFILLRFEEWESLESTFFIFYFFNKKKIEEEEEEDTFWPLN